TRQPRDINTQRFAVHLNTRTPAPMMLLAYLCIGLAFIPVRSIQVALVCPSGAADPDGIPDTNFPEIAAWDKLPEGDGGAHSDTNSFADAGDGATVILVARAPAEPKLLIRRPWDINTQRFTVQIMGRPATTMLLTTAVAFGLDDTGPLNVSAANTPHAAAPGDGRTDESTLPDREPMRHALVHHSPPVRAPLEAEKAASASPSLAVYQRHSLHSLWAPLLHPRSTAFFAEPPSNVPITVRTDDSRHDTPRHSDWHWVPPIGPTAATSAATHSTTPRRPRSLPRHPTPTSILLPPRNILRSLTRKQRRLQREYDGILAHRRAQQEANDRREEHARQAYELLRFALATAHCVPATRAIETPYLSLENCLRADATGPPTAPTTQLATVVPDESPTMPAAQPTTTPRAPALSFWVRDPTGKHGHHTVCSAEIVEDFFGKMVWFDPAVCWVALENRPINLSDSFAGNGVDRDDTLTVMVRMLGGGGRGTYQGFKGSKGAVSSSSETRASPGDTKDRSNGKGDTKGYKGEKGGKTNKGNGKRGGLVWDDGVDSDVSDRADLYRHWEAPETRFKAVFPLHLYEGSYAQASWEEAHSSPYQWAQFYLHSALGRGTINSCWDASAKQEFLRGEIRQTLEILFTTSAANETDVLRASGRAGTYFEPLNQPEDYRVLMLPDGASEGDAHSVAGKIGHLQLGLAYCRGELGVRVKASSYAEARELLPELPAEIAYFAVAGIPCGTNAGTLQRNLMRLGWDTIPLFKLSKAGRHTEWAVKSETHPGTYQCDLLNGLRIAIRRVHRCPIQPSRHVAGMRLSSTFREETGRDLTRRDPLAKGSTEPVRFSVFVERYGKGAPAIWELAGDRLNRMDEDEDGNDEGPDGTPLAGGSAVELRKPAMQYARPDGSLPPARTTSSSPPVDPPRMVADLDERELKTL
ncbi:hypothetical protein DIPPA_28222, partial [Diplonema papillatum]